MYESGKVVNSENISHLSCGARISLPTSHNLNSKHTYTLVNLFLKYQKMNVRYFKGNTEIGRRFARPNEVIAYIVLATSEDMTHMQLSF